MRRLARRVLSLIACAALSAIAVAQNPPPNKDQDKPKPRPSDTTQIGVLEVRLPITVKEKNKFVGGLKEFNFRIFEDGQRQRIERFVAPSQLPLSIAILMDTSESVKLKLAFEKESAEDFVATVTTYRRRDEVLFATFDSQVELHQDFTDSQELLSRAIRKVKAGGYTRLYDGVHRVIEEKMATLQRPDARRIIVILSDGEDTASEHSLKEAIEMAQRYDVTVFGISTKNFRGITSGTVLNADDKQLRELCEETGGQLFLPSEKLELFKAFTEVARDLRQEYVVFYTPQNQAKIGKRRKIEVKLIAAEGHPYHKQGYMY